MVKEEGALLATSAVIRDGEKIALEQLPLPQRKRKEEEALLPALHPKKGRMEHPFCGYPFPQQKGGEKEVKGLPLALMKGERKQIYCSSHLK